MDWNRLIASFLATIVILIGVLITVTIFIFLGNHFGAMGAILFLGLIVITLTWLCIYEDMK